MANVGRRLQQFPMAVRGNGVIRALFGSEMKSWVKRDAVILPMLNWSKDNTIEIVFYNLRYIISRMESGRLYLEIV